MLVAQGVVADLEGHEAHYMNVKRKQNGGTCWDKCSMRRGDDVYTGIHEVKGSSKTDFIEPPSALGWRGPYRSYSSNPLPWACHHPPAHAAQGPIQPGLEHLQRWGIHSFSSEIIQRCERCSGGRSWAQSYLCW